MRVDEVIQTAIIYLQQKGVNTDEQVLRRLEILDKFNSIRAKFLSDMFIKGVKISNINYQTEYVDKAVYSDEENNASYFPVQDTVMGLYAFVGSTDAKTRWREYGTMMEYNSTIKNQIPSVRNYLKESGYIKLDDKAVLAARIDALFVNPFKNVCFNPEYDAYPIDEALIPQLCEALYEVYFKKIAQVKPDLTNNSNQE